MGFLVDVASDIRTERALRSCAVYASCLAIYFFWDHQLQVAPGVVVTVKSEQFWTILMVCHGPCQSMNCHAAI